MDKKHMFEIRDRDGLARLGVLRIGNRQVDTPLLMPVINPNISMIKASDMKEMGCEMVITNAYILKKSGIEKDVHEVLGFDGPVMTDSGTFQSHIYGDIEFSNEEMLSFQQKIRSDVNTIVDEFVEPDDSYEVAERKTMETISRAKSAYNNCKTLALPVQGGLYSDLRKRCAKAYYNYEALFPIGGVVPLMESQRYEELIDVVLTCKHYLNPSMPVHLFGCGHPMLFAIASLFGCDLFDSAAYSKFAAEDRFMFENGTMPLSAISEDICSCPVCSKHGIEEIKGMEKTERVKLIAEHNLRTSFQEIRRVRNAIKNGRIWELAEIRARGNPALLYGFNAIKKYKKLLEHYEPLSRKSSLGTGAESFYRPMVTRAVKKSKDCYISGFYHQSFVPCPAELRYTYPFGQAIMPYTKRAKAMENLRKREPGDEETIRAIARMQFGADAERALLNGELTFVRSRKNNRIRNVMCDGEHILSLRAEDGYFTLKLGGGRKLLDLPYPRMRVVVNRDSEEPAREGKNVFAKFVVDADDKTIIGNEVVVVNENDELLAIGRALMVREEMLAFKRGIAIKIR